MKPFTRNEVILGVVVPVMIIAVLAVLALQSDEAAPWIAFLAAVPMFAAMFARVLVAALVALASVLTAAVCAASAYGQQFADALPILIGVIIGAGAAVLASQSKNAAPRRTAVVAAGVPRNTAPASPDIDDITGLPTRAAVLRGHAGPNADGPRVVALIDCDGLAAFNDEHGRDTGDVFLFAIGGRTAYALAEDDVVARWEGDELLVIMGAPDPQAVEPTLQLVTDKINVNPIRTDAGLVKATISVGAAPWPTGETFEEALVQARRALYEAKRQGPGHLVIGPVTVDPRSSADADPGSGG